MPEIIIRITWFVQNSVENIKSFLNIEQKKRISERAELIKEIYEIYASQTQCDFRKKLNWKRYCEWCKEKNVSDSEENRSKFKRSKGYIKTHTVKAFCYFISPIPTKDLYYIASIARDMKNRKQDFGSYIMGNLVRK